MNIKITEAKNIAHTILTKLKLTSEEASLITDVLIEAELLGKKTHGLIRLKAFKRMADESKLNIDPLTLDIISETPTSLHIDGHNKIGLAVIYKSLDLAFEKVNTSKLLAVGIKNVEISGCIGVYARKAAEQNLLFIAFNNSPGGLVPFGSIKDLWGTNPLTIGIPTNDFPVIVDMSSSKIPYGKLVLAKNEGKSIENGVAIDAQGNITTDPVKAMEGGLLPIEGHKGSALAFAVELIGGALTGSRVGSAIEGGWGSFYLLIDPTLFRTIEDFKKEIAAAIKELKEAPKAQGVQEIFFAGEKSAKLREKNLKKGTFELSDKLYQDLQDILKN